MSKTIKKDYNSDITEFLREFDKKPEAHSPARKAEEQKYKKVFAMRDDPEAAEKESSIWKGF